MRKAIIRIGDKTIEIHLNDDEVRQLLGSSFIAKPKGNLQRKRVEILDEARTVLKIPETWQLVIQNKTEIRGRKKQSTYSVYLDKSDGCLVGVITPSNAIINLGNPSDEESNIAKIMRLVNSMPVHKDFTRKELSNILQSTLGRGFYLKFALDYMQYIRMVKKSGEPDVRTGAIKYRRIGEIENSSSKQDGSQAAGAIV